MFLPFHAVPLVFAHEQDRVWELFARHPTMTLIILYLVYSQVSTVVSADRRLKLTPGVLTEEPC